jgi:excisionase family DNA binding protein
MQEYSKLAVSVEEACRLATIGRTKLYEAIGSGELPSLTYGRRRLIRTAALKAWLEHLERRAGSGATEGRA